MKHDKLVLVVIFFNFPYFEPPAPPELVSLHLAFFQSLAPFSLSQSDWFDYTTIVLWNITTPCICSKFYGVEDNFAHTQLLTRSHVGKKRNLYLVNNAMKQILQTNEDYLKVRPKQHVSSRHINVVVPMSLSFAFGTDSSVWFFGWVHRKNMPLGIVMACTTWCHMCGICQSQDRRMSGHLYTVAVGYQIKVGNTMPATVISIYMKPNKVTDDTLERSMADSVRYNNML